LLNRTALLNFVLHAIESLTACFPRVSRFSRFAIRRQLRELHQQEFVFFTKGDNVSNLNKVMTYAVEDKSINRLKIVTLLRPGETFSSELLTDIQVLDRAY
jgi:hypothetical protein